MSWPVGWEGESNFSWIQANWSYLIGDFSGLILNFEDSLPDEN